MAISSPPTTSGAEPATRRSLRGRLLALLFALTAGLWAVSAVALYVEFNGEGQRLFDESLAEAGTLLLSLAEHEIREHGPAIGAELMRRETQTGRHALSFQIWTEDRRAAYRTQSAPEQPFMPLDTSGFGRATIDGRALRTYAVWNESRTLQIQIAEPLTRRSELSAWTFAHLGGLALLLLPVAMLLIWSILTRSLRPLKRIANDVAARSPSDLQPVDAADAPAEIAPLIEATNRLFGRVRDALQMERRFTADAAHELRSPLAAIRANAQVITAARDEAERREAGCDLLASVDRSSRLIDQLLALARVDASATAPPPFSRFDLRELVVEECARQRTSARARNIHLTIDAQPAAVWGERSLVGVLLRNLIDNALRYSPDGSQVTVSVRPCGDGGTEVAVADDGPGIPHEERGRIYERFYRVLGNEGTGSGLGLSIASRIVALHGGDLLMRDGPQGRGACFVATFPAPGGTRTSF